MGEETRKVLVGKIQNVNVYHTDAYAVAVRNGFEGTEAEWLASLKGDKGEKGDRGVQGDKGDKGEKGDLGGTAPVVQTAGNNADEVMSQKAVTEAVDLERETREAAVAAEKERAENRENEIEALFSAPTQEAVNRWLNAHPEATTTVQDGSIGVEKITDELKNATVKDYVTPEMFGAVGDGVADDSDAIQAAIATKRPCLLSKTYLINKTLTLHGDNHQLTIDGTLRVGGDCGIEIRGTSNIVDGKGEIYIVNSIGVAIRFLVEGFEGGKWVFTGNKVFVNRIEARVHKNNATGIEIIGGTYKGGQCFDEITSEFWYLRWGVRAHDIATANANSWYTAIYIDSVFEQCVQAVVLENAGKGGFIRGGVQPRTTTSDLPDDFNRETMPLMYIGEENITINSFIWDMSTAINLYAIEICGKFNVVDSLIDRKWLLIPAEYEGYTSVRNRGLHNNNFTIMTARPNGSEIIPMCTDSNDVLLGALDHPNVNVKLSFTGDNGFYPMSNTENYRRLFDGTNCQHGNTLTNGTLDFLFEFTNPIALRAFCMWGYKLPAKSIELDVAFTENPDTFISVCKLTADKDYVAYNGDGNSCAKWHYDNDSHEIFGNDYGRIVSKVKVKLSGNEGDEIAISRLSLFSVDADIMKRSGGRFDGDVSFADGAGVCVLSPNGTKFRITVSDSGTIAATKV